MKRKAPCLETLAAALAMVLTAASLAGASQENLEALQERMNQAYDDSSYYLYFTASEPVSLATLFDLQVAPGSLNEDEHRRALALYTAWTAALQVKLSEDRRTYPWGLCSKTGGIDVQEKAIDLDLIGLWEEIRSAPGEFRSDQLATTRSIAEKVLPYSQRELQEKLVGRAEAWQVPPSRYDHSMRQARIPGVVLLAIGPPRGPDGAALGDRWPGGVPVPTVLGGGYLLDSREGLLRISSWIEKPHQIDHWYHILAEIVPTFTTNVDAAGFFKKTRKRLRDCRH